MDDKRVSEPWRQCGILVVDRGCSFHLLVSVLWCESKTRHSSKLLLLLSLVSAALSVQQALWSLVGRKTSEGLGM